jgi:hypothetical protein
VAFSGHELNIMAVVELHWSVYLRYPEGNQVGPKRTRLVSSPFTALIYVDRTQVSCGRSWMRDECGPLKLFPLTGTTNDNILTTNV